jgi:hypothetical protein
MLRVQSSNAARSKFKGIQGSPAAAGQGFQVFEDLLLQLVISSGFFSLSPIALSPLTP